MVSGVISGFFTVALRVVLQHRRYSGKMLLCWQQFYGIAIAFFCRLFHMKKRFSIVIMTFIYKPKHGIVGNFFETFVRYAVTSPYIDQILLTTRSERELYSDLFDLPASKFGFAHCGSLPHDPSLYEDPELRKENYYFATGRSNRDYPFLIRAFQNRPQKLLIACDTFPACNEKNIIVDHCLFGDAMLRRMKNARAVLLAFDNDQIAAGQLTILTAMSLGVPVILTHTHGLADDYIINGFSGIIVPKSETALQHAMEQLESDASYAEALSKNEIHEFNTRFTYYHAGKEVGAALIS